MGGGVVFVCVWVGREWEEECEGGGRGTVLDSN